VIFLYATDTKLASVAAVNIEEAGATAAATALCVVIVLTSAAVKAAHLLADRFLLDHLQAWRRR
jgi:iron(III) transport system permease protein